MVKDHCPLCKSNKLMFIDPFESRQKLKGLLTKTNLDVLPEEIKTMISVLDLDSEPSSEEMEFYQEHGRKVMCLNCSMTYYENDDVSDLEALNAKPVSKEEYIEHLKDLTDDQAFIDFITEKTDNQTEYYLEALDKLVLEYNESFGKNKETLVN